MFLFTAEAERSERKQADTRAERQTHISRQTGSNTGADRNRGDRRTDRQIVYVTSLTDTQADRQRQINRETAAETERWIHKQTCR